MELSPADMGESGGVNGVDLVGRSGARNSQEFRERFLGELADYPYWCSCDFSLTTSASTSRMLEVFATAHTLARCANAIAP